MAASDGQGVRRHERRLPVVVAGTAIAIACLSFPGTVLARGERLEIIPNCSARFGGSFRDGLSGEILDIEAAPACGLTVDIAWDGNTELELLYARQSTRLQGVSAAGSPRLDLDIEYYQAGGTYLFDKSGLLQPYFAATIGATRFSPDRGYASSTRLSFSAGGGAKLPLTRHLGLRFDGRAFVTMIDNDSTVFCNIPGSCAITFRGDTLVQWDASLGLVLAF
jgi:hypothetical protein